MRASQLFRIDPHMDTLKKMAEERREEMKVLEEMNKEMEELYAQQPVEK